VDGGCAVAEVATSSGWCGASCCGGSAGSLSLKAGCCASIVVVRFSVALAGVDVVVVVVVGFTPGRVVVGALLAFVVTVALGATLVAALDLVAVDTVGVVLDDRVGGDGFDPIVVFVDVMLEDFALVTVDFAIGFGAVFAIAIVGLVVVAFEDVDDGFTVEEEEEAFAVSVVVGAFVVSVAFVVTDEGFATVVVAFAVVVLETGFFVMDKLEGVVLVVTGFGIVLLPEVDGVSTFLIEDDGGVTVGLAFNVDDFAAVLVGTGIDFSAA